MGAHSVDVSGEEAGTVRRVRQPAGAGPEVRQAHPRVPRRVFRGDRQPSEDEAGDDRHLPTGGVARRQVAVTRSSGRTQYGGPSRPSRSEFIARLDDPAPPDGPPLTCGIPAHLTLGWHEHAAVSFVLPEVTFPGSLDELALEATPPTRRVDSRYLTGVVEPELQRNLDARVSQSRKSLRVADGAPPQR